MSDRNDFEKSIVLKISEAIETIDSIIFKNKNTKIEADWKNVKHEVKRNNINLCHICVNQDAFPNCAGIINDRVVYGTLHGDNIYECSEHISIVEFANDENTNIVVGDIVVDTRNGFQAEVLDLYKEEKVNIIYANIRYLSGRTDTTKLKNLMK